MISCIYPNMKPKWRDEDADVIRLFIKEFVYEAHAKGVVIGLSGGVDSSVVSMLCSESLSAENVLCIYMPFEESDELTINFAKKLGVEFKIINIKEIYESYSKKMMIKGKVVSGNLKARIRANILYTYANSMNYLVAGTSNKSELLLGYFTKYGDGASDFLPIGDLYKTQVYILAKSLNIPEEIIKRVPSAGLWEGQTDEEEIGMKYEDVDRILFGIEIGMDDEKIHEKTGIDLDKVKSIRKMFVSSRHKRKFPYICKLGIKTIGMDMRES